MTIDIVRDNKTGQYRDPETGRFVARSAIEFTEAEPQIDASAVLQENAEFRERLAQLEMALENVDWRLLTWQAHQEFTRDGLRHMVELARIVALKNPLVKRSIAVKQLYVWGQGWSIKCKDEAIQDVINAFIDDPKNKAELTSHQALMDKEKEQQTDGNQFLVMFVNKNTGQVRCRSFPFEECQKIVCNPDDAKEPWLFERVWSQERMTETGAIETVRQQAYYPAMWYNPVNKPARIGGIEVRWDNCVYYFKSGGYSNWTFGISEIYASLDWSQAYKSFLEDWSAIVRAYRRFAFELSTPGGKQGVAAAKSKIQTTVGANNNLGGYDSNPPPIAGGVFVHDQNTQLTPIRTQGATVSAEDGRRLLLMVAADAGLPETFFGDVSVGTLATANSLDRPTELAMSARQEWWKEHFQRIFDFVVYWAVKAPQGPLNGMAALNEYIEDGQIEYELDWGETDPHIDIDFPPIVQEPTVERIQAMVQAATLSGGTLAGTIDIVTLTRMMLTALGEDDIDEIMEELFPGGEVPEWADPEVLDQRKQESEQANREMQQAALEQRANMNQGPRNNGNDANV